MERFFRYVLYSYIIFLLSCVRTLKIYKAWRVRGRSIGRTFLDLSCKFIRLPYVNNISNNGRFDVTWTLFMFINLTHVVFVKICDLCSFCFPNSKHLLQVPGSFRNKMITLCNRWYGLMGFVVSWHDRKTSQRLSSNGAEVEA